MTCSTRPPASPLLDLSHLVSDDESSNESSDDGGGERHRHRIVFHASEVAALCGFNSYKRRHEALSGVWRRMDYGGYAAALERNPGGECLPEDRPLSEQDAVLIRVAETSPASHTGPEAADIAAQLMASTESAETKRRLRSITSCAYGSAVEKETKYLLKTSCGYQDLYEDPGFFKRELTDGVALGGRIDCRTPTVLIEIKNRVQSLFGRATKCERVQVHCYMFLLGLRESVVVESFTNRAEDVELNIHTVPFDPAFFETIRAKLLENAAFLLALTKDTTLQDEWVRTEANRRGFFLSSWLRAR